MNYVAKYGIWAVRFWYAAWMIPAGIEHFYHIYPQPGANSPHPLAAQMLTAMLNSNLFDLVKGVELIAGLAVLFGFFSPLGLLIGMPVAFCVFWWDAPLSEWSTGSLIAGSRVLVGHLLICVAYIACFRPMLVARAKLSATGLLSNRQLVLAGRIVFGAWMLLNGLNHFFFSFWPTPMGGNPVSIELMTALNDSWLLDVCMLIELVAGALILLGLFVPLALCVTMAVSTSALYWAMVDHQPLTLALGLLAFALNGLLMLAYLDSYRGALQRESLTIGETQPHSSWNTLFVRPGGRTARREFMWALLPLAWGVWWYASKGPNVDVAPWGVLVLLYPAVILHVRRLHDLGLTGWFVALPAVLTVMAMLIWANRLSFGASLDAAVPVAALIVFIGFALWGALAKGRAEANRFGPPVEA
ncbi:MAG: DUF805 domain-containing protein [Nevskiaceae bacterium]|jgi:uncharacterized membrane protein YhaH (DUF805 family)/uncharacterized membrane protein YphA (DoxX/SURF4 family)|nr:DUF805 domain-containing protein [Nevskiaceae bacterium]